MSNAREPHANKAREIELDPENLLGFGVFAKTSVANTVADTGRLARIANKIGEVLPTVDDQ